jgi:hypothetical protein
MSQRDILAARIVITVGENSQGFVVPLDSSQAGVWSTRSDSPRDDGLVLVIFLTVDESVRRPSIAPIVVAVGPSWVPQRSDYVNRIEDAAQHLVGQMYQRVTEDIATEAIQPEWNRITLQWAPTRDFGGFNSAAELARNLETWEHRAAGRWLAQVGTAAGVPSGVAGAGIAVGTVVPLPGAQALGQLPIAANLAGVAFALATGNPVLACASLKSLAHEALIKAVSAEIRTILAPRGEPSPDVKRLAEEIFREDQPKPSRQESAGKPHPDDNNRPKPSTGPGLSF